MRRIAAKTPVAPVLDEPRAASTQVTQLLYGHCAEVVGTEGPWLRMRGADGYEGWLHEGYTTPCVDGKEIGWAWDIEGDISMGCSVRNSKGATLDLPLGAVIGDCHSIAGRTMNMTHRREVFPPTGEAIAASATALFQGTYYQWGGITPWGADCSGMMQSIFALHGIHLLRDAWQQATQGVAVGGGLEAGRAGDLLFFSGREDGHITHVAMAMGNSRAVHVALGRGGHFVEDFAGADDFARALIGRFRFGRRIVV